jgi:hypothetical protein
MDDLAQNPEAQKLAQMLQQQQMQKFLQSMQGVGAMTDAERQQMAMQRDYEAMTPRPSMGVIPAQNGMLNGGLTDLERRNMEQSMGQQGATMVNPNMMRRMPR